MADMKRSQPLSRDAMAYVLAGGRGSPWYRNVRKYQQSQEDNWTDPVTELVSDLTQAARRHSVAGT